jgi:glycosyltransferase involved in cell wall biosynthesis
VKRFKVLISAYACRPGEGSEPGIGWNVVLEVAKYHQVWVITRENNRPNIEAEMVSNPVPGLQFVYYDLPSWVRWWKQWQWGVYFHYYLWQIGIYFLAQKLHREISFDLVHHITYGRYCTPSFLALLPIPLIWGPVGGGESAPDPFWRDFSLRGKLFEILRNLSRWLGERDPFVRLTAQRSVLVQATTEETAQRLYEMGAINVQVVSQVGLPKQEITCLSQYARPAQPIIRFISIGRLLHWKGFHLGLRAFAQTDLTDKAEYWIIGDGPEWEGLHALAEELGIIQQVKFWSKLPREETLQKLGECLALVHPSLHEAGGWVCLEAMAAGRPLLCLDLGGPAIQATEETGFKVPGHTPEQVVYDLAKVMSLLARDLELSVRLGQAGQKRVIEFSWEIKCQLLTQVYEEVLDQLYLNSTRVTR